MTEQVQLRWTNPSRVNKLVHFYKYFQTSNLNTLELNKEKTKTQADNSSFQYFFFKLYSLKTCHHTNISLRTKLLVISYSLQIFLQ